MIPQVKEGALPTVRIDARIPAHIKENLVVAAALQGMTQTDFLVSAVNEAAKRVIAEHTVIHFCLEDQKALAKALLDEDGSPNPGSQRLRQALEDHSRYAESL